MPHKRNYNQAADVQITNLKGNRNYSHHWYQQNGVSQKRLGFKTPHWD